ncbi:innexin shaking-B [Trichonephila inaurata madagascariensis]|uniref:Innexin n=1 Tax=Trichonephila inaurata madagascariensis TaxID=2747483 RepID=A0A8X6I4X9_9ARAC|nr:innexin shaking-B [Trichonephila inaurata madagascariensis]
MLQSFSVLKKSVVSCRRSTESYVFYLHYRVTFLLLMLACLLISSRQFAGDKIQCLASHYGDVSTSLLNAYCWAASTYSVSSAYFKEAGIEIPHPGVGNSEDESEYTFRNYYQYVHLVLFFQALLFYLPHLIWKTTDHDYLNPFYEAIKAGNNKEEKTIESPFDEASRFIEERWGTHLTYGSLYIACEVLSTVNLIVQSYLMDVFLNGEFLGLGYYYVSHYYATRLQDPIRLFPLVTNCYFQKYGASGFVDSIDSLCVLPINALNAKIFLFIWVWFSVLLGLSFCSLLYFLLAWLFPWYRVSLLKLKAIIFRSKVDHEFYIRAVTSGNFGDWFVISCIKNNMDSLEFSRLMKSLCSKLSNLESEAKEP